MCQVCGKTSHTTINCWHRFYQSFQGQQQHQQPSAYTAFPNQTNNDVWYVDTGATHHITNDAQNLTMHVEPYHGHDHVQMGNGTGLKIQQIGTSKLSLPQSSLLLEQLLHVLAIKKNLISISKFTIDNNVFVEFHGNYFCIKDEGTRNTLLSGKTRNGLYPLPLTLSSTYAPQTYFSARVPL